MIFDRFAPFLRSAQVRTLSQDVLMAMDPETAHQATLAALRMRLVPSPEKTDAPELKTSLCGLDFTNPIGMAAGFDKNGQVPHILGQIGFGMAEVGTVTPLPQDGNAKPRLFRLPAVGGVINRMGFNNEGHEAVRERLQGRRVSCVLGINVGANKTSPDFVADYVLGVKRFADLADYLTINISSPNTPGLRDLQSDEALKRLLGEALAERARAKVRVPVFLKIAPDLSESGMDAIVRVIGETDLDGLIVSNTTLRRDLVEGQDNASEAGGLSGKPLFDFSTRRLAQMRQRVGPDMPIIGVGGIHSAASAVAKFEAGANAIQLYSALVFGGMELLEEIKTGLVQAVRKDKLTSVSALTGRSTDDWASGKAAL